MLGSPQAMHAAVLSGFPPGTDEPRPLWRVDADDALRPTLYIVSRTRPDLTHVDEQAGWPSRPSAQSRSYSDLLASLEIGQTWAFRVTVNPTHRATINGVKKIVGHVTVDQQTSWLAARAAGIGVSLGTEDEPSFQLTRRERRTFRRGESSVTLSTATFGGLLTVTDALLLRTALTEGIGRAKAYGCGLLTLARP